MFIHHHYHQYVLLEKHIENIYMIFVYSDMIYWKIENYFLAYGTVMLVVFFLKMHFENCYLSIGSCCCSDLDDMRKLVISIKYHAKPQEKK